MSSIIPQSGQLVALNTLKANAPSVPFEPMAAVAETRVALVPPQPLQEATEKVLRTVKFNGKTVQFIEREGQILIRSGAQLLGEAKASNELRTIIQYGKGLWNLAKLIKLGVVFALAGVIFFTLPQDSAGGEEQKMLDAQKAARLKKQKNQQGAKPVMKPAPTINPFGAPSKDKKTGIVQPTRKSAPFKPVLPHALNKTSPTTGKIALPYVDWVKLNPFLNPNEIQDAKPNQKKPNQKKPTHERQHHPIRANAQKPNADNTSAEAKKQGSEQKSVEKVLHEGFNIHNLDIHQKAIKSYFVGKNVKQIYSSDPIIGKGITFRGDNRSASDIFGSSINSGFLTHSKTIDQYANGVQEKLYFLNRDHKDLESFKNAVIKEFSVSESLALSMIKDFKSNTLFKFVYTTDSVISAKNYANQLSNTKDNSHVFIILKNSQGTPFQTEIVSNENKNIDLVYGIPKKIPVENIVGMLTINNSTNIITDFTQNLYYHPQ